MLLFIIYSKSPLLLNLDTFVDVPSFFSYCFLTFMLPLSSLLLLHFYLLDILFPVNYVRKLPWLSRQSDRLLTDRSLVRSQAEAPFFTFIPTFFLLNIYNDKKYASRGSRTHDRAVKSRALYRLS